MQFFFIFVLLPTIALAQCLFNETHCACSLSSSPGLCARYLSGPNDSASCLVDSCLPAAPICDCSGTSVCERRSCNSWRFMEPSEAVLGDTAPCSLVPATDPEASSCVSFQISSPTPSPVTSTGSMTCPNGESVLDLRTLFPSLSTSGVVLDNTTYTTTYSPTESITAKYITVNGCMAREGGVRTFDEGIGLTQEIDAEMEPEDGFDDAGYCKLDTTVDPNRFESFGALVVQSEGFEFRPTSVSVFDIDNQQKLVNGTQEGTCVETVGLFGMKNGEMIIPSSSVDAAAVNMTLQNYEVDGMAMSSLGLGGTGGLVPGAEMVMGDGNMCNTGSIVDRVPCLADFTFEESIDTLVVLYGYGAADLPGSCLGTVFIYSPSVEC